MKNRLTYHIPLQSELINLSLASFCATLPSSYLKEFSKQISFGGFSQGTTDCSYNLLGIGYVNLRNLEGKELIVAELGNKPPNDHVMFVSATTRNFS